MRPFNSREKDLKCFNIIHMDGPTTEITHPESSALHCVVLRGCRRAGSMRCCDGCSGAEKRVLWRTDISDAVCCSVPHWCVYVPGVIFLSEQRRSESTRSTTATTPSSHATHQILPDKGTCGPILVLVCFRTRMMVRLLRCTPLAIASYPPAPSLTLSTFPQGTTARCSPTARPVPASRTP